MKNNCRFFVTSTSSFDEVELRQRLEKAQSLKEFSQYELIFMFSHSELKNLWERLSLPHYLTFSWQGEEFVQFESAKYTIFLQITF